MNKLLQYLIDETNVEGRVLPGLQKMQRGGGNKTLPTAPTAQQLFGNNPTPITPTVPYVTSKNPADFYKSWIQSPEYARRQSNTGYSASAKDESYNVPSAAASRKTRLDSLGKIDPITYNTREASKATPGYYGGASSVNINPSDYIDTNRQMIEAHELGHIAGAAVNEGTSRPGIMSSREQDIFKSSMLPLREPTLSGAQGSKQREASRRSLEDFIHSQKPQELKADLDALRYSMYDKGVYDIRKGTKFSDLDFENARQKFGQDRVFKRLENRVGKKNFVNLMNTIAQDDNQDSYSNIAEYGGPIIDPRGQWAHPGKITRIPSDNITMQGVPYPVYGVGSNGQQQMMYPEQEYNFGGASYVDEYPMMQFGGGTLLGPLPMMSKIVPKVVSMFSGDPLKKFINWVNEPSETTGSTSRPSPLPVEAPVRTYGYSDTHSEYRDRANDVYSELKNNDSKEYNSPKQISLSSGRFRGAKVDPEMINDIVNAAKANNVDPWVMLSLVGRESTFGSGAAQNTRRAGNKQDLVSGWNVAEEYMPYEFNRFLADRQVPGVKVHKDNHGWQYTIEDKKVVDDYLKKNPQLIDSYYKKIESTPNLDGLDSFALAAQRIKKKGIQNYNPGDPKYSSMVNSDMGLLKQDAELKAYMKSKGYKEGGQLGSGLLSKTIRCSSCGWSWKSVDGGIDPLTCHKCGGVVKMQGGGQSSIDSVRHQANKILQYEQLRGGPGGAPLPQYSNSKYMDMLMGKVYPEVRKIMPNASAMEAGEAMDFVFNAGFDQGTNKITKDPRAFALQEYYRQNDPSKLDADGKWAGRKNAPYSFDQEYNNTIGKLPENQRRILMNKGRDWYYKNINNPAPGVPNSNYNDTWYGRIWNTNDYQPFNPNNPNFTPKKEQGGEASLWDKIKMAQGGFLPRAQDGRTIRAANGEFSCAANPRSDLRASAASVSGGSSDPLRDDKNNYWGRIKEDWQAQGVNKESFNNMYEDSLRAGPAFENPISAQYFDPSTGKARPGTPGRLKYYNEAGFPLGSRLTLEQIKNTALQQPKGIKGYNKLVKDDYPWGVSPYIPTKLKDGGYLPKMQMAGSLLQPITAQDASNVLSLFSVPQKAITKLFTGKYQTPSEAMDIKNPYGAFAADAILDPVNLVGAGILGNMAKASTKTGILSKTYKINPLAKKKPDVILTRTQKPGQTDALRKFDEVEAKGLENPNFEERFEYKQRLKSPHLRHPFDQPGYGRGFSSDLGDISYYSYPNIQATRGYEGFPEILKTRISAKEAEKFNVGKNPLQGYISFAPKREYLLPKDMLYSAESFIPNKGYSAGPQGATEPGSIRDFVKKAYAEQTAANIPNWLTGYPSKKLPGLKSGGQHGGLDRWFAEKWVDVKTGKDCGRQEGESRAGYPACRPSKRVNSQTPKTSSEMSSAEKAKFKSSKTSSQRIDYNHKRNK
jgi:hypothetical protein